MSQSVITRANTSFTRSGGCRDQVNLHQPHYSIAYAHPRPQIASCDSTGDQDVCSEAQSFCNNNILSPLAGNYDVYYVLTRNPDPYPPALDTYLGSSALMKKIGAQSTWEETNDDVYSNFAATGDWMTNSRPNLEKVINAGVRTIVYDGDAVSLLGVMLGERWYADAGRRTTS